MQHARNALGHSFFLPEQQRPKPQHAVPGAVCLCAGAVCRAVVPGGCVAASLRMCPRGEQAACAGAQGGCNRGGSPRCASSKWCDVIVQAGTPCVAIAWANTRGCHAGRRRHPALRWRAGRTPVSCRQAQASCAEVARGAHSGVIPAGAGILCAGVTPRTIAPLHATCVAGGRCPPLRQRKSPCRRGRTSLYRQKG